MLVKITLEAMLELPDGTKLPHDPSNPRCFTLPGGDWIKPWIILERNDIDDLGFGELVDAGIDLEETRITIEAAGWAGCGHTFKRDAEMINVCTKCGVEGEQD